MSASNSRGSRPEDHLLVELLGASARQIRKAGAGAIGLVGSGLHGGARRAGNAASQVIGTATGTVDRIEQLIELRVTRFLNSLQIPTARDVQQLSRRVEELSAAVARLSEAAPGTPARPARTSAAKSRSKAPARAAKRKTVRKKPAAGERRKSTPGRASERRDDAGTPDQS